MLHIVSIFNALQSSDVLLRQRIIEGVSTLLAFQTDIVMKHLDKIMQIMIAALRERD